MAPNESLRILIFDSTRLRSHLFFRYVSTHPDLALIYHPYLMAAMFSPEYLAQHLKHSQARSDELEQQSKTIFGTDTYTSRTTAYLEAIAKAELNGKIPIANEHGFNIFRTDVVLDLFRGKDNAIASNPTVLPDNVFDAFTPIILIRHPALAVDSIYRGALSFTQQRPGDEDFSIITPTRQLRLLFDYYRSRGQTPIIVDGEDLLRRTKEMSSALCERLGIDAAGLSDTWSPASQQNIDKMNPLVYMLTKDIQESSGIERLESKVSRASRADSIDVD